MMFAKLTTAVHSMESLARNVVKVTILLSPFADQDAIKRVLQVCVYRVSQAINSILRVNV